MQTSSTTTSFFLISHWAPFAAAFVLSLVGVRAMIAYANRAGLIDVPNHRSSHSTARLTGGGAGLVLSVILVGSLTVSGHNLAHQLQVLIVMFVAGVLALVGWYDDKGSAAVGLRALLHFAAGVAIAVIVNTTHPLPGPINLAWLAWWTFWTAASINIVNFMDGIDGMAGSQGLLYGIFLVMLLPPHTAGSTFGLVLAGATLGFLFWNWAPARIFMGDVGSGPLGLLFVLGGALALQNASAVLVFLPLFPLFLDALITIVIRIRNGEKLTSAHRSHLYQRMANGGVGHAPVTTGYFVAGAVGALVAVSIRASEPPTRDIVVAIYCAVVALLWVILDRRFPRPARTA